MLSTSTLAYVMLLTSAVLFPQHRHELEVLLVCRQRQGGISVTQHVVCIQTLVSPSKSCICSVSMMQGDILDELPRKLQITLPGPPCCGVLIILQAASKISLAVFHESSSCLSLCEQKP